MIIGLTPSEEKILNGFVDSETGMILMKFLEETYADRRDSALQMLGDVETDGSMAQKEYLKCVGISEIIELLKARSDKK